MGFKSYLALVFLLTSYVVSASDFKGFKVVESCVDPNSFNGGPVAQVEGHSASACAILCSNETQCRSFTFRLSSSTCFLHGKYITDWPCGQSNDVHYNDVSSVGLFSNKVGNYKREGVISYDLILNQKNILGDSPITFRSVENLMVKMILMHEVYKTLARFLKL